MNNKYLAAVLTLGLFAAVVALAQFDGSKQIAAVGSSANVQSVGVNDYPVKNVVGGVPIQGGEGGCAPYLSLPSARSGQMLRCSDKDVASWVAVSSLYGVGTVDDGINSPVGVRGLGPIGVWGVSENNTADNIGVLGSVTGMGVGVKGKVGALGSIAVLAEGSATNDGYNTYGFFQKGEQAKNRLEGSLSIGFGDMSSSVQAKGVKIQIDGGLRLSSGKDHYTCSDDLRGTLWFTQESSGVADYIEVCAKNANGTYSWKNLF